MSREVRSRVSVGDEDAANGVEMKAVYSALDGHDPGGVRYGRLNTIGDKKPALRHAEMFCQLVRSRVLPRVPVFTREGSNHCAFATREMVPMSIAGPVMRGVSN